MPYAIAADAGQWVEFREPSGGVPVRVAAFRKLTDVFKIYKGVRFRRLVASNQAQRQASRTRHYVIAFFKGYCS